MSTLKVSTIKSNTASTPPAFQDTNGVEVGQLCRAWVNFNGTGTVAIADDLGVSSITDGGTGTYTVNLDVAMPTANYAVAISTGAVSGTGTVESIAHTFAVGSFRISCNNSAGGAAVDCNPVCGTAFGD